MKTVSVSDDVFELFPDFYRGLVTVAVVAVSRPRTVAASTLVSNRADLCRNWAVG